LQYYKEETALKNYEPNAAARIAEAERTWKAFLVGQLPHPGAFQQHILPLDGIEAISSRPDYLSPNINRYLMRMVDMDLCRGEETNFVYSKLGRFVILGFIRLDRPSQWQGTKVHVKTGRIAPRKYTMPKQFFRYLNSKARCAAELQSGISPRQGQKIDRAFRANIDNYIGSDEFIAMENDIRMFGDSAFMRDHPSDDEGS
jgi:hypothetical protein